MKYDINTSEEAEIR